MVSLIAKRNIMKRFLIVQFREGWGEWQEQEIFESALADALGEGELRFVNAFRDEAVFADPEGEIGRFDGVILGGSSDFFLSGNTISERDKIQEEMLERLGRFFDTLIGRDIPTLGICFGHQLLGRHLGVEVKNDPEQMETGTFALSCTEDGACDVLFHGVSDGISAHFVHRDSLAGLPKGAILLASGIRSKVAAFRHGKNVYGVQFHPELSRGHLVERVERNPGFREAFGDVVDVFSEGNPSAGILENFFRKIA